METRYSQITQYALFLSYLFIYFLTKRSEENDFRSQVIGDAKSLQKCTYSISLTQLLLPFPANKERTVTNQSKSCDSEYLGLGSMVKIHKSDLRK